LGGSQKGEKDTPIFVVRYKPYKWLKGKSFENGGWE